MRDARRANGEKPTLTKEQRLEKMNKRLDKRIALQNKMKTILTEDQFQEFKRMEKHDRKRGGRKGKMKSRHGRK